MSAPLVLALYNDQNEKVIALGDIHRGELLRMGAQQI